MGCVTSKHLKKTLKQEQFASTDHVLNNHVVSLTSSTYGLLKLDQTRTRTPAQVQGQGHGHVVCVNKKRDSFSVELEQKAGGDGAKVRVFESKTQEELEVINTWELMSDLEEEVPCLKSKKSPKSIRGTPFKRLQNQVDSPKVESPKVGKVKGGKENVEIDNCRRQQCYTTPRGGVLKSWRFSSNSTNKLRKVSSMESPRRSNSGFSSRRRSLSPLFDPELIESLEKELNQEKEQIKEMVVGPKSNIKSKCGGTNSSSDVLKKYVEKCPPGGEDCVVIYTTTLRGIRKTFEECNAARLVIESYQIRVIERDVSMDSGYKEELRKLMGTKEVKVPLVFVKGRLIGGAEDIVKLDEEGKLEGLLEGIPKALNVCEGCGGIRFVMCMECNGSCKVLDESKKNMVKCGECNENGLIHCPICC